MTVPVSPVQAGGMVPSRTKENKMKVTRNIFAIVVFSATVLVGTATAQPRMYPHQQQQQGPTALGLKAWGERLQGEARVYQQQQQQGPTALGLKAWGERLQGEARVYQQQQQQGPTALGLKAWGERLQGEARVYQQQPPPTVRSSAGHFDWSDAGIGAMLGFALAIGLIGALLLGRRFRRTQFATF
jgi:hypothetical protein